MSNNPPLVQSPERLLLEPFATIFLEVVVPESASGGWFEALQTVPTDDLDRITRRIDTMLSGLIGRPLHPAIWVHALLVCGHFVVAAAEMPGATDPGPSIALADAAFSLVQSLVIHHQLNDLYLLLG